MCHFRVHALGEMSDSDKGIELQERSSEEKFTEIEVKPENGITNPVFEEPSVEKMQNNLTNY